MSDNFEKALKIFKESIKGELYGTIVITDINKNSLKECKEQIRDLVYKNKNKWRV